MIEKCLPLVGWYLAGENQNAWRKYCSSAPLSTINPTQIVRLKADFRRKSLATSQLRYGEALLVVHCLSVFRLFIEFVDCRYRI
jgi:hypothetical protein